MKLQYTAWVTIATLILYIWVTMKVASARGKFGVKAPEVNGPPGFLNVFRVQANTLEQMMLFLPSLWLCAIYLSDLWALAGGVAWLIGRVMYALAYYVDPTKRGPGFSLSFSACIYLMIAAVVGLLRQA